MGKFRFPKGYEFGILAAGMILANQRHERFAALIATGQAGALAYRTCYRVRGGSAAANASRLLRNANVQRRIAELQAVAATEEVMSLGEKRLFLAAVVRTPIGDVDESSPLCQYFQRTKAGMRVTMVDKLRAIELDAKLAGELKGSSITVNATATAGGFVLTEERRAELIARKRAAMERNAARSGEGQ